MKQTDNLKMHLPEESDVVDIEQLNDNFRMLDTELSKLMTGGCVATNIKIIDKAIAKLEAKKAKADAAAEAEAKKAEAQEMVGKLLAEGMSVDEILEKLK